MSSLDDLEARPWESDFHQAMRRIECAFPELPRAGEAFSPKEEPVRLGQDPSLEFVPAALRQFRPPREGKPGRLRVGFLGLFGPQAPLPLHFTELARNRQRLLGDRTLGAFVDLFQHRMLLLFHRAWAVNHPAVREDRPHEGGFRRYLAALAGALGRPQGPTLERAQLGFVARFLQPARNAEGLEAILGEYFACPVQVREYLPEWLEIPQSQAWRLGRSPEQSTLGHSTVVGRRVFQPSQKFRVELGPLSHATFQRFLPGTTGFKELTELVSGYAAPELSWDLRLRLAPRQRPNFRLGRTGRLGRDIWLGRRADQRPSSNEGTVLTSREEDVIVDPRAHASA
jgi:type VI secretion system protein ImpH